MKSTPGQTPLDEQRQWLVNDDERGAAREPTAGVDACTIPERSSQPCAFTVRL